MLIDLLVPAGQLQQFLIVDPKCVGSAAVMSAGSEAAVNSSSNSMV